MSTPFGGQLAAAAPSASPAPATSDVLTVGLVIPLQGPGGMFAPSCEAVAELAAAQINAGNGVCGRELRLQVIEGGDHPLRVAERVRKAVDNGEIQAVTGWHISAVRHAVAPVVGDRVPYVYTSLYEGGERREGVICSGEVPSQQIRPAMAWLREQLGLRRWVVVGDDYVWPRASAASARQYCRELGLSVQDEIFVRYGSTDLAPAVRRVAESKADAVLMLLVGDDAVLFNREFAAHNLHARMARFTPLMEENMLYASGADATENLYVAAAYFSSLATANAMDLLSAYTDRFGAGAPALNNMAESCYEGMLMLDSLHKSARSCGLTDLIEAQDRVGFDGPRGPTALRSGSCDQQIYLARAAGLEFNVMQQLRV